MAPVVVTGVAMLRLRYVVLLRDSSFKGCSWLQSEIEREVRGASRTELVPRSPLQYSTIVPSRQNNSAVSGVQ